MGPRPLELLGIVLLTSLGTLGLPQMVGKFYTIRDKAARLNLYMSVTVTDTGHARASDKKTAAAIVVEKVPNFTCE